MNFPAPAAAGLDGIRQDLAGLAQLLHSMLRPARRRWWVLALVVVLPLITAAPAAAVTADGTGSNPWLAFFQPKDSHGFSPWQYELSIDQGGVTDPGKSVSAFFAAISWMFYRFVVIAVMWLLDFVLQFKQLDLLRPPAEAISQTIQSVTGQVSVVPMFAVISVVVSGVWLFRGRSGAAFGEILSTVVITALIGTVLSNPMGLIAGPDGALALARDFGLGVSSQMVSGTTTPQSQEQMRTTVDAKVLDNLVRTPHQLINYGQVLDRQGSPSCISTYNTSLGQVGARDQVGDPCGAAARAASDDTMAAALGVGVVGFSGGFFFLVVLVLAVALLVFTGLALWEAAKFVVEMIKSILPGAGRTGMFVSACTMVVCVCLCAVILMAVGILLLTLESVFTATASWPPVTVFLLVDLVLICAVVAGFVMMFKAKKSGRKLGENLGKSLTPRPGSLPSGGHLTGAARQLAQPALQMRQQSQLRRNLAAGPQPGQPAPGAPSARAPRALAKSPGTLRTVGKVAVGAGKVGLQSTIGAPVYAPRAAVAAKKAMAARKTVMATKLATARQQTVTRVSAARDDAASFGREYVHNVSVAGRVVGKATGIPQLARAASPGTPDLINGPGTRTPSGATHAPERPVQRSGPSTTAGPPPASHRRTYPLRPLKQVAVELPLQAQGRKRPPPPAAASTYEPSDHRVPRTPSAVSHAGNGTPPPPPPLPSPITRPQTAAERLRARLDRR